MIVFDGFFRKMSKEANWDFCLLSVNKKSQLDSGQGCSKNFNSSLVTSILNPKMTYGVLLILRVESSIPHSPIAHFTRHLSLFSSHVGTAVLLAVSNGFGDSFISGQVSMSGRLIFVISLLYPRTCILRSIFYKNIIHLALCPVA